MSDPDPVAAVREALEAARYELPNHDRCDASGGGQDGLCAEIDAALAALTAHERAVAELVEAARKMLREADGSIGCVAEWEWKELVGVTNYTCLRDRADVLRAALARLEPKEQSDAE